MNAKFKYLSQNILLFTISGMVPKALSFLMVPFYTSVLTPTDYGISDLIATTVMLLVPIFTLDMQDAVLRYSLDKNCDLGAVLSSALHIFLKGLLLVIVAAFFVAWFDIPWLKNEYIFFVVLTYAATALGNILNMFCRGINEIRAITISTLINTAVTIPANLLFLAVFRWGITGFLIANVLGQIVAVFYLAYKAQITQYFRWHVPAGIGREMAQYSIPLIFNVIAWWVNSVSDRYYLAWISGVAISGIFAVALKIPSILAVFQGIFYQAWSISAIKDFDKEDKDGFMSKTYTLTSAATILVCSGIMFFNMPLSWFLYSKDFFQAWKYVPLLLLSFLFNAMALFVGAIFTAVKDTKNISYSTLAGAGVNLIATLILVYCFDAYGAAVAMLLGYLTVFLYRATKVRQHISLKINWQRECVAYTVLFVQMGTAFFGWIGMVLQILPMGCLLFLYKKEFGVVVNKVKERIGW